MTNHEETLLKRIEELETRYNFTETEFHKERQVLKQITRRLRVMGSLAVLMCIGALIISPDNRAIAQGYGESLRHLMADVSTLKTEMSSAENKTQFMSVSSNTTFFTACNVQIDNRLGSTDGEPPGNPPLMPPYFTNGLGNLIIGYNQYNGQPESGSHNLILGDGNGYSSFGGIVAGYDNLITGPDDSITGGRLNHTDGYFSSISGGEGSLASNEGASVTGGQDNVASDQNSSCLGGFLCRSDDPFSAVLGGYNSTLDTGNSYTHFS